MPIKVYFYSFKPSQITKKLVAQVVKQTLSLANIKKDYNEVSVALLSDQAVKKLNYNYRQINKPTDVLSFSGQTKPWPGMKNFLGEIVIAKGVCQRQAQLHQHSFKKEFIILLIHGTLHLLGYDHQKDKPALIMESLEAKILKKFYESVQ